MRLFTEDAHDLYDEREEELGEEIMRALERYILLDTIDGRWREHLYDMDYLREGIHLRGFAQIEPIVAYKNEAYSLFTDLMHTIWSDFARMVYHVEVEITDAEDPAGAVPPPGHAARAPGRRPARARSPTPAARRSTRGRPWPWPRPARRRRWRSKAPTDGELEEPPPVVQRRVEESEQIGRNDPCWCGSGKKYKKCHGA